MVLNCFTTQIFETHSEFANLLTIEYHLFWNILKMFFPFLFYNKNSLIFSIGNSIVRETFCSTKPFDYLMLFFVTQKLGNYYLFYRFTTSMLLQKRTVIQFLFVTVICIKNKHYLQIFVFCKYCCTNYAVVE